MEYPNFDLNRFTNRSVEVSKTDIPGMLVVRLVINPDGRGWLKESFQLSKLVPLGFPSSFQPVGYQVAAVQRRGFTRGIHADTVNKYISLTRGEAFAAIVDLRRGSSFGRVETVVLTPENAIFVPRGCGNSYQTLTDDVGYSYLEDGRTSSDPSTCVSVADKELAIEWPVPLQEAHMLPDDEDRPALGEIAPVEA